MAGWTPPGPERPAFTGEVCPSCGQLLVDHDGRNVEVEHAPRRGPWLAAGAVLIVAIVAVGTAGVWSAGDDTTAPPPDDGATSTTDAASTSTTVDALTAGLRAPVVVWPADLPEALTSLTYAVGGESIDRTWLITLDRSPGRPLWEQGQTSGLRFAVITTDIGVAVADEAGLHFPAGDDISTVRRLGGYDWTHPPVGADGVWAIRNHRSALPLDDRIRWVPELVHSSLAAPTTELEQIDLPFPASIAGLWEGRPLLGFEDRVGTYWVEPDGGLRRVASGQPLVGGSGRLVEVACDDALACGLQVVDLATGTAVPVSPAPADDITAGARSADGNAVVVWNRTDLRYPPFSINLVDGTVRPFSAMAAAAFADIVQARPDDSTSIGLDPTGRYLLDAVSTGVHVLDVETGADWTIGVEGGTEIVAAIGGAVR